MNPLSDLINVIINTYFFDSICLIYVTDIYTPYMHLLEIPLVFNWELENNTAREMEKCKQFIVHSNYEASVEFKWIEEQLAYTHITFSDRKYIIIVYGEDELNALFKLMYLLFVRDVLVIDAFNNYDDFDADLFLSYIDNGTLRRKDDDIKVNLYTHKYVGISGHSDRILLDTWFASNETFQYGNRLFPDKISDQEGRELRAPCYTFYPHVFCATDPPIGTEYNIIVNYAKRFNLTLNLFLDLNLKTEEEYDDKLIKDYFDLLYGGRVVYDPVITKDIDLIRTVTFTYIVNVPFPTIKYGYLMFINVFDYYVWLAIIALFTAIRGISYIRIVTMKHLTGDKVTNIRCLTVYGFLVVQGYSMLKTIKDSIGFLIVLHMLIAGILLTTAFNSRLASVLVKPIIENDISTLDELAESKLILIFPDAYHIPIINDTREVYKKLCEKMIVLNETFAELLYRASNISIDIFAGDFAFPLYQRDNGMYMEEDEVLASLYGKFNPIKPELFRDYYYIYLRKNSMHTVELKKLMGTIIEAGLMSYWEDEAVRYGGNTTLFKQMHNFKTPPPNALLNLQHLKGLFVFWGCGLLFSIAVFIKEAIEDAMCNWFQLFNVGKKNK